MERNSFESRKRRNANQDVTLVNFMRKYPNLANSAYGNRAVIKELWGTLTTLLNSRGPKRDAFQWRKVWADWKNYVRKKILENKIPLNAAEKSICEICKIRNNENRNTNYQVDKLTQPETIQEDTKQTVTTNCRIESKSRSNTRSRTSSPYSRSLSRSSSPTVSYTSSMRSRSSTPSTSTARSEKSTENSSPVRSYLSEDTENAPSLIETRDNFHPNIMALPAKGATQACFEESIDNLEGQFRKQTIALQGIAEMLEKNISTQKQTLETAKQISSEVRDLNKCVNQLTDGITEKYVEKYLHNKQMELLRWKKIKLQIEMISLNKILNY